MSVILLTDEWVNHLMVSFNTHAIVVLYITSGKLLPEVAYRWPEVNSLLELWALPG